MEAKAAKRLICVTGLGAGDSRGHGGLLYNAVLWLILGRVYADKDVQERIIRRSRLDWTIVRPTVLTNGPRTGAYRVLGRCARLALGVHLARRRGGFSRQANQRCKPCSQDASADPLRRRCAAEKASHA